MADDQKSVPPDASAPPDDELQQSPELSRHQRSDRTARAARPFFERIFGSLSRSAPASVHERPRNARRAIAMCHALLSERGEVSGIRLASETIQAYRSLEGPARHAFFDLLVDEFSADPSRVTAAAENYLRNPSQPNLSQLAAVVEAPRQELFRRVNLAPAGARTLIDIRQDIGSALANAPRLSAIDDDLLHLFRSWFSRGFLVLQRIDWRTSALVLERLIQYEAG